MARLLLVFGNDLVCGDDRAVRIAEKLDLPNFDIRFCRELDDFITDVEDYEDYFILDVAEGIEEVTLITDLDRLESPCLTSLHDFDLAFFLKLKQAMGDIKSPKIIAIPSSPNLKIDEIKAKINSILT